MSDHSLESCSEGGVVQIRKHQIFSNFGGSSLRFSVFSKFGHNNPKGHILDSNGLSSLKVYVAIGKQLISVKNSKYSLIFGNFGYFGKCRVKKRCFLCPTKLEKANFQRPNPMVYSKTYFEFCVKASGGLLLWDTYREIRNLGPKSHMSPFFTYHCF